MPSVQIALLTAGNVGNIGKKAIVAGLVELIGERIGTGGSVELT